MIKKYSVLFLMFIAVQSRAMATIPQPKTIDDIPDYCASLRELLEKQPKTIKNMIAMHDIMTKDDAHLFLTLSHYAHKIVYGKCSPWDVENTNTICLQYSDETVYLVTVATCSVEEIRKTSKEALISLKTNWLPAKLTDHADLEVKKSDEQWLLYTKESTLQDEPSNDQNEPILINTLASKFNLKDAISCHAKKEKYIRDRIWRGVILEGGVREPWETTSLYLWVKKGATAEIQKTLGLDFRQDK